MDSGKSTLALQTAHNHQSRGRKGLIFSSKDRAGSGKISSRIGLRTDAIEVDDCIQIITLGWKLRRFSVVETGLFNQDIIQQIKTSSNNIGVNLLKRSDFEDVAKELDQIPELQGLSFRRDCKEENANIKLNTMYIRTLVCRQKLIDIYFARRNQNKNQKIN